MDPIEIFWSALVNQSPMVILLGFAVYMLWQHILKKDTEHRTDIKELNATHKQDIATLNAQHREQVKEITGSFASAMNPFKRVIEEFTKSMNRSNAIQEKSSRILQKVKPFED